MVQKIFLVSNGYRPTNRIDLQTNDDNMSKLLTLTLGEASSKCDAIVFTSRHSPMTVIQYFQRD